MDYEPETMAQYLKEANGFPICASNYTVGVHGYF